MRSAEQAAARWSTRQRVVLVVLSGNMVLDAIEVSLVLIALPSVGADLGLSPWGAQWLMSGFALGFAAMLVTAHRITRYGRRRAYLAAMALFAVLSVLGGLSHGVALLVATRLGKGLCAALTAPTGLAIIGDVFADGAPRRRAVSLYSFLGALGFSVGLLLGGVLVMSSWRWVFLAPAPVAVLLLVLSLRVLPGDQRGGAPAVPVRRLAALVRDRALLRSGLSAAILNGTYQSLMMVLVYHAQDRLGWRPWVTAVALLPACLPLALVIPFAGRLIERFGAARLIALGAVCPPVACAWYLLGPGPGNYPAGLLPVLLLFEAGFGCAFAPLNMRALAATVAEDRAAAVALYQALVQVGAVLMLPLVAACLTGSASDRPAVLLITAVSLAGLVVGLLGLGGERIGRTTRQSSRMTFPGFRLFRPFRRGGRIRGDGTHRF